MFGFPPDDDSGHEEPNQEKDKEENENRDKDEDIGMDNNKDEDKGVDKDNDEDKGTYVYKGTCICFLSRQKLGAKVVSSQIEKMV